MFLSIPTHLLRDNPPGKTRQTTKKDGYKAPVSKLRTEPATENLADHHTDGR